MGKGYVVFDLSTLYGTSTFLPGKPLPRHNKAALELYLANILLRSLSATEHIAVDQIQSNPNDPPDVLFEISGQTLGLELVELLPENRLERDAIIRGIKKKTLSRLNLSEKTKDRVITIMLSDDYAVRIQIPRCEVALATALNDFFVSESISARKRIEIPIPEELRNYVRSIFVESCDLDDDHRIKSRQEPLIVFTAQHTNVVPDKEFPQLISQVIQNKEVHDLSFSTWLLLWSNHYAFGPLRDHLVRHINQYLLTHLSKYTRVFYLHLHASSDITEFIPEKEE